MTTSKYFSNNQKRTLGQIMELMIPSTPGDPGAADVGAVEFVDYFFDSLPEGDRKDLIMLVKVISRPFGVPFVRWPKRFQVGLINFLKKGRFPVKAISVQLKLGYFAFNAMTMTAFYSNFSTPDYEGPTAWDAIGFDVPDNMIPEGALERPELAHIKRWKERKKTEVESSVPS